MDRLPGRTGIECGARVCLRLEHCAECKLQRNAPGQLAREGERAATATGLSDKILDVSVGLVEGVTPEEDVQRASMRHRPLGLIRSQIFERAFGVGESARTVGAAKGVEIRAHTEEEAGSCTLGSVELERVEAGTRIGVQLGHVNDGGEQLSLDLAGLLVIVAWPFGKRLLEGARRF